MIATTHPLHQKNFIFEQVRSTHPAFIFFACSVILLSVHPSLQYILLAYGISSTIFALALVAPIIYLVYRHQAFDKSCIHLSLLFCIYITWMIVRGIFSSSVGDPNFIATIRGLMILVPLSLLCASIAARNADCAAVIIFFLGLIAVVHFVYVLITRDVTNTTPGFISLSSDPEKPNYQATSYYFGLSGLYLLCISVRSRGVLSVLAVIGSVIIIILMGMTGARSSIIALGFSLLYILFLACSLKFVRRTAILTILVVAGLVFLSLYGFIDLEALSNEVIVIDRLYELVENEDSSDRERLFGAAIAMWLDSPLSFFIGGGLASFPSFIGEPANEGWYPHNFILESLAEGGLVAFLLLLPIGRSLFIKLFLQNSTTNSTTNIYLGSLALYSVVSYQFMGGLQTLWIPTFFVALFLTSNQQRKT